MKQLLDGYIRVIAGAFRYPSRFVFNCEKVNLEYVVELPQSLEKDAIAFSEDRMLSSDDFFDVGDRIYHQYLGSGEIQSVELREHCYCIKFDNLDTPRNLSFYAELKQEGE